MPRKTRSPSVPAWVPCECCEDFLCTIHFGKHAYECRCPSIDTWAKKGINPYLEGGNLKNYNLITKNQTTHE